MRWLQPLSSADSTTTCSCCEGRRPNCFLPSLQNRSWPLNCERHLNQQVMSQQAWRDFHWHTFWAILFWAIAELLTSGDTSSVVTCVDVRTQTNVIHMLQCNWSWWCFPSCRSSYWYFQSMLLWHQNCWQNANRVIKTRDWFFCFLDKYALFFHRGSLGGGGDGRGSSSCRGGCRPRCGET